MPNDKEFSSPIPQRQIRAVYDNKTIRVYQAYSNNIADTALARGTFVSPPFSMKRMTWIKPSFLWMMYRSGWGLKDVGQARILAIDISREGFEWALAHSCPSHPDEGMSQEEWQVSENALGHPISCSNGSHLLHSDWPEQTGHRSLCWGMDTAHD